MSTYTYCQSVRPNNRRRTCNFTDQISVLVGHGGQLFLVHKDIICAKSDFFSAARSERWQRGSQQTIRLPDVDPSVFQSYLSWVYSTSLNIAELTNEYIQSIPESRQDVAKYIELYLVEDVLGDVRLRNKAIQTLVRDTSGIPYYSTLNRLWDKTPEKSPIREMIVRRATLRTPRVYLSSNLTKYPEDFVQQLAASLLQLVPTKDKEIFEKELPSYLEPVAKIDQRPMVTQAEND